MIFRQLFDSISCTFTYMLASHEGGEALLIDSVLEKVDRYMTLLGELDLKLAKLSTLTIHADHITALGALRDTTHCITVMSKESSADVVSIRVEDGDKIGFPLIFRRLNAVPFCRPMWWHGQANRITSLSTSGRKRA